MYLKYFLESGIFAQDSKDSESRTLFYFLTDPSHYHLAGVCRPPLCYRVTECRFRKVFLIAYPTRRAVHCCR